MQKSSFFNSVGGDRKYKAEEFAEYFASFIGNGVFPNPSINLMVEATADMKVVVRTGKAWVNGYMFYNTSDFLLEISTADGVLKRIDRIVLRWSLTTRSIILAVKKGTPASTPVAPTLQRDADIYEMALADIAVNNGVIQITAVNITDLRLNSELCGYVTQMVQTINTSTLAAQLEAWFAHYQTLSHEEYIQLKSYMNSLKIQGGQEFTALQEWFAQYKAQANADFIDWFNALQDILDQNAETNILNLINMLTTRVDMLEKVVFNDINTNPYLITFENLNGIIAEGVWNQTLQRLEC